MSEVGNIVLLCMCLLIHVVVWLFIAKQFERIAIDKGYGVERHSFIMVFLFGIIGIFYVWALPDRNLYPKYKNESDPFQEAVDELQKYNDLFDSGVISQEELERKKNKQLHDIFDEF